MDTKWRPLIETFGLRTSSWRPEPFSKSQRKGKQDYNVPFYTELWNWRILWGISGLCEPWRFFFSLCLRTQNSGSSASSYDVQQPCEQVPVRVPVYGVVISCVQQMEPLQVWRCPERWCGWSCWWVYPHTLCGWRSSGQPVGGLPQLCSRYWTCAGQFRCCRCSGGMGWNRPSPHSWQCQWS